MTDFYVACAALVALCVWVVGFIYLLHDGDGILASLVGSMATVFAVTISSLFLFTMLFLIAKGFSA